MPATLVFKLTGGASNSDPNACLGGVGSSVSLSGTRLNNLFDDVLASEADSGDVEYRALDIYNDGDAEATGISFYISSQSTSEDTSVSVGLDSTTQTVATESNAPSGVTFTEPTQGSPLSVSNIAVGGRQRFWVRRTVSASAENLAEDICSFGVTYS